MHWTGSGGATNALSVTVSVTQFEWSCELVELDIKMSTPVSGRSKPGGKGIARLLKKYKHSPIYW